MLGGEPGIGKSRLVQELFTGLPETVPVLDGQADPGTLSRPFEVLLDAIDSCHRSIELDPELPRDGHRRVAVDDRPDPGRTGDRAAADDAGAVGRWSSRTCTGPTRRASRCSSGSPTCDGAGCSSAPTGPDEVTPPAPDRRPADPAGAAVRGHPRAAGAARPRRDLGVPRAAVDGRAAAVPGRDVAAQPHRRQPVLPRGAAARPRRRRPGRRCATSRCRGAWPRRCARQLDDLDPTEQRHRRGGRGAGHRVAVRPARRGHRPRARPSSSAALRDLVGAGCWSRPARTSSRSGTRWCARRSSTELLGRQRRRLHEAALDALLATGGADPALVAHHARGAGRYDDMVDAARRRQRAPISRSARRTRRCSWPRWASTRLPDDAELLPSRPARRGWPASSTTRSSYGRRWLAVAGTRERARRRAAAARPARLGGRQQRQHAGSGRGAAGGDRAPRRRAGDRRTRMPRSLRRTCCTTTPTRHRLGRPGDHARRRTRPAGRVARRQGGEGLRARQLRGRRRRRDQAAQRGGAGGRAGGGVAPRRPVAQQPVQPAARRPGGLGRGAGADAGRRRAGRVRVPRGRRLLPGTGAARGAGRATSAGPGRAGVGPAARPGPAAHPQRHRLPRRVLRRAAPRGRRAGAGPTPSSAAWPRRPTPTRC